MTTAVPCPLCKVPCEAAALLSGLCYWRGPGLFTGTCPACGGSLEFRVQAGTIEFGYTYWAGSMHFEGMFSQAVPGLRRVESGGTIFVELDGVSYPARATG